MLAAILILPKLASSLAMLLWASQFSLSLCPHLKCGTKKAQVTCECFNDREHTARYSERSVE